MSNFEVVHTVKGDVEYIMGLINGECRYSTLKVNGLWVTAESYCIPSDLQKAQDYISCVQLVLDATNSKMQQKGV